MKLSDIMANAGLSMYAEVALILFFVAFVGIVWWVVRSSNRERFRQDALIPLNDETPQQLRTRRQ